jgi:hypothetical protein
MQLFENTNNRFLPYQLGKVLLLQVMFQHGNIANIDFFSLPK